MPTNLPTASSVHSWLARAAHALVEAPTYGDKAEVAWVTNVDDPHETCESLADSGPARFRNLDMLRSRALRSRSKGGELGRGVPTEALAVLKPGGLLAGRQVAHIFVPALEAERGDADGLHYQRPMCSEMVR